MEGRSPKMRALFAYSAQKGGKTNTMKIIAIIALAAAAIGLGACASKPAPAPAPAASHGYSK